MSTDGSLSKGLVYYENLVSSEYQWNTLLLEKEKKDYSRKRFAGYSVLNFAYPEVEVLKKVSLLGKVIIRTTDNLYLLAKIMREHKSSRVFTSFAMRDGFFGFASPLDKPALEWAVLFHWRRSQNMVVWPHSNRLAMELARGELKDAFETFWGPRRASPPDHRDDGDWSGGWKRGRGRLPSYPLRKTRIARPPGQERLRGRIQGEGS